MGEIDLGLVVGKDSLYKVNIQGSSGNMEYSNGVKECWGYNTIESGQYFKDITLPIEFTDNNFNPMVTSYQSQEKIYIEYVTSNSIRVSRSSSSDTVSRFYYRCIGR